MSFNKNLNQYQNNVFNSPFNNEYNFMEFWNNNVPGSSNSMNSNNTIYFKKMGTEDDTLRNRDNNLNQSSNSLLVFSNQTQRIKNQNNTSQTLNYQLNQASDNRNFNIRDDYNISDNIQNNYHENSRSFNNNSNNNNEFNYSSDPEKKSKNKNEVIEVEIKKITNNPETFLGKKINKQREAKKEMNFKKQTKHEWSKAEHLL